MENEYQKMQRLAGVPVTKDKKQLDENFVGLPMIGNIFDRPKADYELAYEHYLGKLNEIEDKDDYFIHNESDEFEDLYTVKRHSGGSSTPFKTHQQAREYIANLIDTPEEGVEEGKEVEEPSLYEEVGADGEENPIDSITMDVPLFIRMLEFAREDASTDMDLHNVAEKATAMSAEGEILSMDNYEDLVGAETETEEI